MSKNGAVSKNNETMKQRNAFPMLFFSVVYVIVLAVVGMMLKGCGML